MLPLHQMRSPLLLVVALSVAAVGMTHAFSTTSSSLVGASSFTSLRLADHSSTIRGRVHEQYQKGSTLPVLSMSFQAGEDEPMSRSRVVGIGLSGWMGLTVAAQPGRTLDITRKVQEQMRIRTQEEFDNVEALASPEGGKTLQPVLALKPIITLRLQLDEVENDLKNPRQFGDALAILQTQDFQKKDIKRVFNAYSDNIYYLPGSDRENKYLQGGATPSSRQTLQYLLRNDVIDNVEALTAEIAYLIREREADRGDGSVADVDEKDLRMYLGNCKKGFDKYLGMVLQNEIDEATEMAKAALAKKKSE